MRENRRGGCGIQEKISIFAINEENLKNMKNKIGVDLGGTNMRVGVVANGRIIEKEIIPCPAQADKMTVVNTLADLIAKYITP